MPYKVIFLIINQKIDRYNFKTKELLSKFFDLYSGNIKYFFVESKNLTNNELIEDDHHIYINGSEKDQLFMNGSQSFYPNVYKNTMKALNYIENKYEYDYIIKTNLNIFWNIENLLKMLNNVSYQNFAGGYLYKACYMVTVS